MRRPLETHTDDANPEKRRRTNQAGGNDAEIVNDVAENEDLPSYESEIAELQIELGKNRPKKAVVKKLMKSTFLGRREWITKERPLIHVVLDKFPCLSKSKYVRKLCTLVYNDVLIPLQ